MATPLGQISCSQINAELGNSPTAQISMGSAIFRNLGQILSGQISMGNMRGKSNSVFAVSPGAGPGGSTWDPGTAFNITSGDYTLTAQQPYTFTAYIWGAGGSSSPTSSGGAGGFASATFSGSAGDVYVLKSNFGGGSSPSSTGGGGYGIFASSFSHANSRLIAGGGGGGGLSQPTQYSGIKEAVAGGGGGTTGQGQLSGAIPGGGGGTSSAGGTAGSGGSAGSALQGANGGVSGSYYGGSGGGGYYGGGSGGTAPVNQRECADYQYSTCFQWVYNYYTYAGGGAGGSGYVHPSLSNPVNNGASGSTVAPSPAPAAPVRGTAGNVGQPGRIYLI